MASHENGSPAGGGGGSQAGGVLSDTSRSRVNVRALIERNAALKSRAANFRNLWEEAGEYIIPRKSRITVEREEGNRSGDSVFDTTAEEALLIFAAGLLQYLTPPGEIWARIEPADSLTVTAQEALGNLGEGTRDGLGNLDGGLGGDSDEGEDDLHGWFAAESEGLMRELHASNFYLAIHEAFISLGAFGTACIHLDEEDDGRLNFREAVVGSFHIAENSRGQVDTVFREWKWTARLAVQEWGVERLGRQVLDSYTAQDVAEREREFTFIHAVYPRAMSENAAERDGVRSGGAVEGMARPWASIYICVEDEHLIVEDGYYEMPYAVCRLLKSNGEVYGRGPGLQVLPNLRLINRMEYDGILALEKALNPSVLMPDDAAYRPDNRPGGIMYWDASNPLAKPEWLESRARIDLNEEKLGQIRERINRAWFVPMFHSLNNSEAVRRQKTAFEVEQMLQEKMADFSPMFARITEELLGPLLQRAFAMRVRGGRAIEVPESVLEGHGVGGLGASLDYKLSYTGEIALRIKAAQDRGTLQAVQLIGQLAQFDPSLVGLIRWGDRLRDMLRNMGVPNRDILTRAQFSQLREEQARVQEQARAQQALESMSSSVRNMGASAQEQATDALSESLGGVE